jgi:hypothetical protein
MIVQTMACDGIVLKLSLIDPDKNTGYELFCI